MPRKKGADAFGDVRKFACTRLQIIRRNPEARRAYLNAKRETESGDFDLERHVVLDGVLRKWGLGKPIFSWLEEKNEGTVLHFRFNLDYPVDLLVPLIEVTLRAESSRYPRRRFPKKWTFYLKVFDLARSGDTFKTIAGKLRKPLSTVKSAYLTSRREIFGTRETLLRKKELPLANFDWEKHIENCKTCRAAQDFDHMCNRARSYATQDHQAQTAGRELQ